jgi:hypothetical protein
MDDHYLAPSFWRSAVGRLDNYERKKIVPAWNRIRNSMVSIH